MDNSELARMRHSCAHVMADAVTQLYPGAKLSIGPSIENGFYYDFDLPKPISTDDLPAIEARMREIVAQKAPFVRSEVSAAEARKLFKDEPFKLELIDGIVNGREGEDGESVAAAPAILSTYKHGAFVDLCRGPHVENTGQIGAFKLLSVAGAYWRGDEHNKMLTRIYGTCFPTQAELDDYIWKLAEAEKRDHRRLGKDLDLFSTHQELGGGLVLWHPNGGMVRHLAEDFCRREHIANGYDLVYSPHIGRANLWETSGHLGFYKENMYAPMKIDEDEYYIKPMNCPFHILIYKNDIRSYRDLPLRYAEWGTVYRYERAGVLHGLMRVRGFTQDDAHIFVQPDRMEEELSRTLDFCLHILRSFGFTDFKAYLATRPEKAVGELERWDAAMAALRHALERAKMPYHVDEGGGVFYGPKIDLKIKDAIGREWQCSTIQFDFNLPERFDLSYIAEDGQQHRPYMIHRALLGSMERFFGVLIEHYAGAFPLWLAPVQAMLIPIADRHLAYAREVEKKLKAAGLRVKVDDRGERMNAKIREAQMQKIPYMLVIGDKEQAAGAVAVRLRSEQNLGPVPLDDFIARAQGIVNSRESKEL
jgi:threonyl-tRNA synthetase